MKIYEISSVESNLKKKGSIDKIAKSPKNSNKIKSPKYNRPMPPKYNRIVPPKYNRILPYKL